MVQRSTTLATMRRRWRYEASNGEQRFRRAAGAGSGAKLGRARTWKAAEAGGAPETRGSGGVGRLLRWRFDGDGVRGFPAATSKVEERRPALEAGRGPLGPGGG